MKITKLLIGSLAIPVVVTPITTLTGCGSTWGSQTPLSIGSVNSANVLNPYYVVTNATTPMHKDVDNKYIDKYIQSNYILQNANNTTYAYSSPMKFEDKDEKTKTDDGWTLASSGWYAPNDSALTSTATDKYEEDGQQKTRTVLNARNATLSSNSSFVTTIGAAINNYLLFALQYQAQQLKTPEGDGPIDETDLQTAWGNGSDKGKKFTLSHGTKDATLDTTNSKFYEYLFALANINGAGESQAMLRTSSVGFNFLQMPLPTYTFIGDDLEKRNLSDEFAKLLEGKDATAASLKAPKYFTSKKEGNKDSDEKEYTTYTYESVPIKIRIRGIRQAYLNPNMGSSSFIINDYYSTDDQIKNSIGNQWKDKMPSFTGLAQDDCVPHYNEFTISTPVGFDTNKTDQVQTITLPEEHDLRLNTVCDPDGCQFIALVNYAVNIYKDDDMQKKNTAMISAFSNLFPAYLLELYDDLYKDANDSADVEKVKILDINKVNNVANKLLGLIKRTSDEGQKPHARDLNQESKNLLTFLGYVFANANGGNTTINTENTITTNNM